MVCWGIFGHTPRLWEQCPVLCCAELCCCVLLPGSVGPPLPAGETITSAPNATAWAARHVRSHFSLPCRCLLLSVASSLSWVSRLTFCACKPPSRTEVCAMCEVLTFLTLRRCLTRPPRAHSTQSFPTPPANVACGGRAAMLLT